MLACAGAESPEPSERARASRERPRSSRERLSRSGPFQRPAASRVATLADGQALVDALDIPASLSPTLVSLSAPDLDAAVVRSSYGVIQPTHHSSSGPDSFVLLGTGLSGDGQIAAEPGTDFGAVGADGDVTTLQLSVVVPTGVTRMSFDYTFLSAESPEYINTQYNDTFKATVSDAFGTREIARASVNLATFHPAAETTVGPCPFQLYVVDPSGVNTEFNLPGFEVEDAGTTGYQRVDVAVASGPLTLTFDIRDLGDGVLDSAVILDNVQFSSVQVIDPQPGLIDTFRGQVIRTTSSDPADLARLASGGTDVRAVVADGVTQLLLRAVLPGPGRATFAITSSDPAPDAAHPDSEGSLSADDGPPSWGPTATTDAVQIGGKWIAFALYRSPPDFNRGGEVALAKRVATLALDVASAVDAPIHQAIAIELVRPPVVIVPDIWSSCLSWTDGGLLSSDADDPRRGVLAVSCADYLATSSRSFDDDDNGVVLEKAIRRALQAMRDAGAAATRVDVIGQGMGAILTRRYIDAPSFVRFDNYNAGEIHRLISMNAPHLGARLIDEMIRTRDAIKQDDAANGSTNWLGIRDTLADGGIHFDDADQDFALQEMRVRSPVIHSLGNPVRPAKVFYHAVVNTGGHDLKRPLAMAQLNGTLASAFKHFIATMENNHPATQLPLPPGLPNAQSLVYGLNNATDSYVFCSNKPTPDHNQHDLFMTLAEQRGGLAEVFTTAVAPATGVRATAHFNTQRDTDNTGALLALLNAPVTGGQFATSMPRPADVEPTNDCPIEPPLPIARRARSRALVAPSLAILSPMAGTEVTPGSAISVSVSVAAGPMPSSVLIIGVGDSVQLEAPPFTADLVIPLDAIGTTTLRAIAFYGGGDMAFAAPVELPVVIDAALTSLEILNGDQVLRRPGRTQQLRVTGGYSDGTRRDVTAPARGTRYRVSQLDSIITVSPEGMITANGPGVATVTVTNGAARTSINVRVGEPACGDGVLDPGEECDDGNVLDGDRCDPRCRLENRAPVAMCASPTRCTDPGLCVASVTDLGAGSQDPDGDALSFTQVPAGPYGVGSHEITVTAFDGALDARCVSQLDVNDCEAPSLTCPGEVVAECKHGKAFVVPAPASASDNCGAVSVKSPPAKAFPLGSTSISYKAKDPAGNPSTCNSTIRVVDTSPPHATANHRITLWPADHGYRTVHLKDCALAVHDACGGWLSPSVYQPEITCVTSDEPDDAPGNDDGKTHDDIVIVDRDTVKLRAERDAHRKGRVYEIHMSVRDAAGNLGNAVCEVTVPRAPHGPPCSRGPVDHSVCR